MTKYEELIESYEFGIKDAVKILKYQLNTDNVFYVPIFVDIARRKKQQALNLTLKEASQEI